MKPNEIFLIKKDAISRISFNDSKYSHQRAVLSRILRFHRKESAKVRYYFVKASAVIIRQVIRVCDIKTFVIIIPVLSIH